MSNLGFGVMINMLGGNKESVRVHQKCIGKEIQDIDLHDDILHIEFTDGYKVRLWDDGQSCCELRYITTDDKLGDFIGATWTEAELREAPDVEDEWESHEVQFLLINTSKGTFTLETHNKHNGYYGGFGVVMRDEEEP